MKIRNNIHLHVIMTKLSFFLYELNKRQSTHNESHIVLIKENIINFRLLQHNSCRRFRSEKEMAKVFVHFFFCSFVVFDRK